MSKSLTKTSKGQTAIAGLGFSDHPSFHTTVLRAAAGGGIGALAVDVISRLIPGVSGAPFTALVFGVAAGSLAMIAGRGKRSVLKAMLGGALGLVGGLLYAICTPAWPWFGALLLGGAAAPVLAKGESGGRMAITGLVAGCFTFAGLYVASILQGKGVLVGTVPGPVATALAGCAAGLFLGLGSLPRHLIAAEDPVETAYLKALKTRDGEIHEILARAFSIYSAIQSDFASRKGGVTEAELGQRVPELAMQILTIAEQCRSMERGLQSAPLQDLEERIIELQRKADATKDDAARNTYSKAIKRHEARLATIEASTRGFERIVAKLHANVALLENVRFALVHARSADAQRIGGESSSLSETVEELSRELEITSQAVGEVFGGESIQNAALESDEEAEQKAIPEVAESASRDRVLLDSDDEAPTKLEISTGDEPDAEESTREH